MNSLPHRLATLTLASLTAATFKNTHSRSQKCLGRLIHGQKEPVINTAALARCPGARLATKLFQQFVRHREKPLKRLNLFLNSQHRAEAAVLMTIWSRLRRILGPPPPSLSHLTHLTYLAYLTSIAALLVGATAAPAAVSLTVGPNINITRSPTNNAEECIAINPKNPLNLFVSDTWALPARYSMDGGLTWNDGSTSALPPSIGDVSAAFDDFGNLYLVRFGSSQRIVVGLSTNGGATFSQLFQSTSVNNDQPSVVTGPSNIPGQDSVWITYTLQNSSLVAQGAPITGLGAVGSFTAAQSAASDGDYGDICVGPTGQVMVVYQLSGGGAGPDTLHVNLDPNGLTAGGFGAIVNATTTQVGSFAPIPAQPQRDIDSEAGLAWDHTGGPHNGRVYLVYTDRPTTSSADTDIYVRFSDDNGTTWSSRVRVNDDTVGNGKSQFLPRIALDQTSGYIAVSFYDCRNSSGNNTTELWATISTDGGLTFLPNVKVSRGSSSALGSVISSTQFDYGDYAGLAFQGGTFYPVWADNSNSTSDNPAGTGNNFDIYTARVTVNYPLVILNPHFTNATFHASVQTVAAKTYFLESTASVATPVWSPVTSVAGDGTIKELVDPNATAAQKFYRVRSQ